MLILTHVIIALSSLGLATYAYLSPTRVNLRLSYSFVALTLLSGFYLTWTKPAHILQTCLMGLFYLGAVTFELVRANQKLVRVKN